MARELTLATFILLLSISIQSVYGQTATVTPGTVTQGENFEVSGGGFSAYNWFLVSVFADNTGGCIGSSPLTQTGRVDGSGNIGPVTFSSSNLGIGTHCVNIIAGNVKSASVFVTVTSS